MDAMTMPYKLKDASILGELHPGDVITADLLVSQDPDADVLLDHIVVVAQASLITCLSHVSCAAPGDAVPISSCATRWAADSYRPVQRKRW